MFDCKQYLIPWRAGMPVLVKVKGEFRIYHSSHCTAKHVSIGDEKMRELKLSSPLKLGRDKE